MMLLVLILELLMMLLMMLLVLILELLMMLLVLLLVLLIVINKVIRILDISIKVIEMNKIYIVKKFSTRAPTRPPYLFLRSWKLFFFY